MRGKEATKAPIIDASNARNGGLCKSVRFRNASRKDGSCGNGARGCIWVKKSSTRSLRVGNGKIDSALRTAWDEKEANVAATLSGDVGDEIDPTFAGEWPVFCFLIASACLFGGPRRLLSLSFVQGRPRALQGLQGSSLSHCTRRSLSIHSK